MAKNANSISKIAVWALLGLLIVALGGFGATNLSGTARTIGSVGEKYISVDSFAQQMQQEMQALGAQTGEPVNMARARQLGLDQAVLSRLVQARGLDHEAGQMGISVGDAVIRDEILNMPAFRGADNQFDRDAYRFALDNAGTSESQFEAQLRDEISRSLLQNALMAGVEMPSTFADTLAAYIGESRDVTWVTLGEGDLPAPITEADDADLQAFYEENIEDFFLPEAKQITYAVLLPDALLAEMDVSDEQLRRAYEDRSAEFNIPERRLVERLVFENEADANQAAAQVDAGGTTFAGLVEARGLTLADVDLGDVDRAALGAAADAVFEGEVGAVLGPLPSDLGPALFRVNAVLEGRNTPLEEARDQLRDDLARDAARRLVEAQAESFEDMLAGGATLEELAAETDMTLASIDWWPENGEGIAAYTEFRDAAQSLTAEDFPTIQLLSDGGIFAMRLDDTLPPRPIPFEEARDSVETSLEANRIETALTAVAEAALPALQEGQDFAEQGFAPQSETGLTRTDFVPATPVDFMTTVFEMAPGEVRVIPSFASVTIVRLDGVSAAEQDAEIMAQAELITQQTGQALANDLFELYNNDVLERARPQINQQIVEAVLAQFP